MKRILLAAVIAATLAVLIGLLSYYYGPGYVVFSFADTSIETSFIFMLGFLTITFFILYYLLRVLSIFFRIPDYLGLKYSNRQAEKARNALVRGLIEMSEGRFSHAEKILLKQVRHSDTGLLNYLMAARSAQLQGAYERRDEYLRLAHETTPDADIAIGITQAELQLAHKQYEQALATLNHLNTLSPKHSYVRKLQARVYHQLGDWDSLEKLINEVRKHHLLDDEKLTEIETDTYSGLFNKHIKTNDYVSTSQLWKRLPKHLKERPELLRIYVLFLINSQRDDEAEGILRNYLGKNWNETLVRLYAQISCSNANQQLERAETWLLHHQRNADLLLALGILCIKAKLWGKAVSYLESSLGIRPMSDAYLELAQLMEERMDKPEQAQAYYRKGLKLASGESRDKFMRRATDLKSSVDRGQETAPILKIIQ